MALGGGKFTAQNKVIPGSYINVIGVKQASSALSDRGIVAIPYVLDFGKDGEVIDITASDFQKNSLSILGYDYSSEKMKGLRDVFEYAKEVLLYKICGSTTKATCAYATAKYAGARYNDIKLVITESEVGFLVKTYIGEILVDTQDVKDATTLVDNAYVVFDKDATLAETAGTNLSGAEVGTVTTALYQAAIDKFESYSFNAIAYAGTDETVKKLIATYVKRLRDEVGMKTQAVLYNYAGDYEGVVNVSTKAAEDEAGLVYWAAGVIGGIAINKSATNLIYSGEYTITDTLTQSQLEDAILDGKFVFNMVSGKYRVLKDINSLVSIDDEKTDDFKMNQVIRVLDTIANDIASLFNKRYLGKIQNNESGRTAFWSDLVLYGQDLAQMSAIEVIDPAADIVVTAGDTKESVSAVFNVTVVCAMEKLYMTVYCN